MAKKLRKPNMAARARMKAFVTWGASIMQDMLSIPVEVTIGPRGGVSKVRSAPGEAPRRDSGKLMSAARGRIFVVGSMVVGEVAARQRDSKGMKSEYGFFLQRGAVGGKSANPTQARPFITMTADKMKRRYKAMLKTPYEKEAIAPLKASVRSLFHQQARIVIRA